MTAHAPPPSTIAARWEQIELCLACLRRTYWWPKLAAATGLAPRTLARYSRGEREPGVRDMDKVERALVAHGLLDGHQPLGRSRMNYIKPGQKLHVSVNLIGKSRPQLVGVVDFRASPVGAASVEPVTANTCLIEGASPQFTIVATGKMQPTGKGQGEPVPFSRSIPFTMGDADDEDDVEVSVSIAADAPAEATQAPDKVGG